MMKSSTELIKQLIALQGPPGEEKAVREWLKIELDGLLIEHTTDSKGNLIVEHSPEGDRAENIPRIVVTAHMDEIALMVTRIEDDGKIRVQASGGSYPWKWGEGPVDILTRKGPLTGILSFGSIHTDSEASVAEQARKGPLLWKQAYIFTGKNAFELENEGVRPGLRCVLSRSRRIVTEFGEFIASFFIDDRADLAVWLLALNELKKSPITQSSSILFAATSSEEVGGEGAQLLLREHPSDICIALEIGPRTPDAYFPIDAGPTIWVRDGYAAMEALDGEILEDCCREIGISPHWQYLSRGGSDASCAAAIGLVARPITLGLPVENSHGYEIMHKNAPEAMVRLLMAYIKKNVENSSGG